MVGRPRKRGRPRHRGPRKGSPSAMQGARKRQLRRHARKAGLKMMELQLRFAEEVESIERGAQATTEALIDVGEAYRLETQRIHKAAKRTAAKLKLKAKRIKRKKSTAKRRVRRIAKQLEDAKKTREEKERIKRALPKVKAALTAAKLARKGEEEKISRAAKIFQIPEREMTLIHRKGDYKWLFVEMYPTLERGIQQGGKVISSWIKYLFWYPEQKMAVMGVLDDRYGPYGYSIPFSWFEEWFNSPSKGTYFWYRNMRNMPFVRIR